MGYDLRRKLRVALGPKITGLQRAVALEIADDARDETRLSYATLENLALWAGAKDANVVRNALKRLAAEGWEFRVPLGTGKDGRTIYAVPGKRVTFRVPDFEGVATATPSGTEGVAVAPPEGAPARSQGAGARSERAGATPFSSAPQESPHHLSSGMAAPEAAAQPLEDEREIHTAPPKTQPRTGGPDATPTAAQRAVRTSGAVPPDQEAAFIAWVTAKHQVRSPGFWRASAADIPELATAWRADGAATARTAASAIPPWCGQCGDNNPAAKFNPRFRYLGEDGDLDREQCPECHPDTVGAANRTAHP